MSFLDISKQTRQDQSLGGTAEFRRSVCIVTPAHLASNPRVVKEADALHEAGFDVHVVFAQQGSPTHRAYDAELVATRNWSWTAVHIANRSESPVRWALDVAAQRGWRYVPAALWRRGRFAERAESRAYVPLSLAASSVRADLYIGHYVEGLAAAASAADRHGAHLGFDAEDLHTGESNPIQQLKRIDFIERRYLRQCTYLSAASAGIGDALVERYGIARPITVHNTFPWADRREIDNRRVDRQGDRLSLYWYSQVIGLDRGIQDAIRAMAMLGPSVELHLRGALRDDVKSALAQLASEVGVRDRLHFHLPVSPADLLSRAAEHDVGLALEQGVIFNRAICATNKLFFFMLAGLAIAATDVPGQRTILTNHPEAAGIYAPGDPNALAKIINYWLMNREALERAKRASLEAARDKWNWEMESQILVAGVKSDLGLTATPAYGRDRHRGGERNAINC